MHSKPLNGSRILIAGITYKPDIDDLRESPALDVMGLLHHRGAQLSYADPFISILDASAWPGGYPLISQPLDRTTLAGVDCVAILTDHRGVDYHALACGAPLVVDTRNAVKAALPHVFRLGAPRWPIGETPARTVDVGSLVSAAEAHG